MQVIDYQPDWTQGRNLQGAFLAGQNPVMQREGEIQQAQDFQNSMAGQAQNDRMALEMQRSNAELANKQKYEDWKTQNEMQRWMDFERGAREIDADQNIRGPYKQLHLRTLMGKLGINPDTPIPSFAEKPEPPAKYERGVDASGRGVLYRIGADGIPTLVTMPGPVGQTPEGNAMTAGANAGLGMAGMPQLAMPPEVQTEQPLYTSAPKQTKQPAQKPPSVAPVASYQKHIDSLATQPGGYAEADPDRPGNARLKNFGQPFMEHLAMLMEHDPDNARFIAHMGMQYLTPDEQKKFMTMLQGGQGPQAPTGAKLHGDDPYKGLDPNDVTMIQSKAQNPNDPESAAAQKYLDSKGIRWN